jgi:hypothetical protein
VQGLVPAGSGLGVGDGTTGAWSWRFISSSSSFRTPDVPSEQNPAEAMATNLTDSSRSRLRNQISGGPGGRATEEGSVGGGLRLRLFITSDANDAAQMIRAKPIPMKATSIHRPC